MQHTCKGFGLVCGHCAQVSQIALVSDQHDDDIRVSVVAQLLQPPSHVFVCLVLADVVYEQGADGAAVVCRGDGAVALLAGRVPHIELDLTEVLS